MEEKFSREKDRLGKVFEIAEDVGAPGGTLLVFTLDQQFGTMHTIGRLRISLTLNIGKPQIDALATTLSDLPGGSLDPGDVTWAYQWDFDLAASGVGSDFQISKDKRMGNNVPEPSILSVLALGLALQVSGEIRSSPRGIAEARRGDLMDLSDGQGLSLGAEPRHAQGPA